MIVSKIIITITLNDIELLIIKHNDLLIWKLASTEPLKCNDITLIT